MVTNNIYNVHARGKQSFLPILICCHLATALSLTLASCQSDWRDGIAPQWSTDPVAFTSSVVNNQKATRADGSIVNLNETTLPSTKARTYYRYNPLTGKVEESTKSFQAGIFGAYTGQHTWASLIEAYNTAFTNFQGGDNSKTEADFLASSAFTAFAATDEGKAYCANMFFNQPATIADDGTLDYTPLRFWPNNKLTSGDDAGKYEYCTFWAYYPYNEAGTPGSYGVSIVNSPDALGTGTGMGRVHFTMNPDASQQSDFMISLPATDCNRDKYPLKVSTDDGDNGFTPTRVPLRFYHMLAQVRLYAFIRGTDKLVYVEGEFYREGETYTDEWGMVHTVTAAEAGKIRRIDEEKSERWARTQFTDIQGQKYRADIRYKMEFNNIKTEATFYPKYTLNGVTIGYDDAQTLGSATVDHFIMNPYWFRFHEENEINPYQRYQLNDKYMFGHFEDTPVYKRENATSAAGGLDGIDWSDSKWNSQYNTQVGTSLKTTPLHYLDLTGESDSRAKELEDPSDTENHRHFNYAPGNILMVVPQVLRDEDVPHIVLTATDTNGKTARVTINMLKMNIKWESGFIYCYAFLDELHPGDDIVRGPESITVIFDTTQRTDQW